MKRPCPKYLREISIYRKQKKNDFKYLITRKGFAFERFYPVIISLSKPDPVELSNMMDGTMTTLDTHFKR